MAVFKVKMDKSIPHMEEQTKEKLSKEQRQTQSVSVKLSKRVLREMKRKAGVKNQVSDNAILHAFITKMLNDAAI